MNDRTTYHRNAGEFLHNSRSTNNLRAILDYVRLNPDCTAAAIAAAMDLNVQTVRNHLLTLAAGEYVQRGDSIVSGKAHEYTFRATGSDDLIQFDKRNCIVERTTPKSRGPYKKPEWINPYGHIKDWRERIEAIARDIERGLLAPQS